MCSIRIFAKNMGDPYYEPTIVVHDIVVADKLPIIKLFSICINSHISLFVHDARSLSYLPYFVLKQTHTKQV